MHHWDKNMHAKVNEYFMKISNLINAEDAFMGQFLCYLDGVKVCFMCFPVKQTINIPDLFYTI